MPTWSPPSPLNSDYSNPANWVGGVIPTTTTDAVFDAALSNQNCNIDSSVRASSSCRDIITQGGYSGQINFNNGLYVNRNVTLNSGTFAGAQGFILVGATSAIQSSVTFGASLQIFRPTGFGYGITVTFANPFQVNRFLTATDGGSGAPAYIVLLGAFELSVTGDLIINHPVSPLSTMSIVINGTGSQGWISNGSAFGCNITINKSAGGLAVSGTVGINSTTGSAGLPKTFAWQNGAIAWLSSTLSFRSRASEPISINYTSVTPIANLTFTTVDGNNPGNYVLLSNVDATNVVFAANTIVINGLFNLNTYGNFTHSAATAGTTKFWIRGTGTINMTYGTANDLEINSTGAVNAQQIVLTGRTGIGTTFTYTAAVSLTPGKLIVTASRNTVINPGSATFTTFRLGSSDSNTPNVITLNGVLSCQDLAVQTTGASVSGIEINGSDINISRDLINDILVSFYGNTTIRFTGGVGAALWYGGIYGMNFVINKAVNMITSPNNFFFTTTGRSITVNTPLGSINPGTTSATVSNNVSLALTRMQFWNLILGTGALPTLVNVSLNITTSLLIGNTLTLQGTSTFIGTAGFTTTNFIGSNVAAQTYTFRRGMTYTINGNFSISGASSVARVTLQSDTRNDFTGTISGNQLTVTSGTNPIAGMRISQRSGLVPQQLAALYTGPYPYRPVVTAGAGPFTISPALASPLTPAIALAGGLPAYITLGPTATQNVIFASTQDIDSFYGNPVFPSSSLPDSAGEPNPNLYRTVNWGVLAAPGLPLARTFCS